MATTVNSILTKLKDQILNDSGYDRWTEAELVAWINEAQVAICSAAADAKVTTNSTYALTSGFRQSAPADAIRILDVVKSSNSSDSTVKPVRRVQKTHIAAIRPNFYATTAADNVREWFYDEANPRQFEVYPPATANARVEIIYNPIPTTVSAGGNLDIADHYAPSVVDYVAYRAFSKDTEDVSPDLGRATAFYNAFASSLGLKEVGDQNKTPRSIEL